MDPVRNPYAPGAGQRPPELAGRGAQLAAFDVVLERVAHGRPERSIVLTGLRGVGKTVLLNALRSAAVRRGWGTGKLEARPDQGLRRPLSSAVHQAVRELGHPDDESVTHVLGVVRSFAERDAGSGARLRDRWHPGIDAPSVRGRADSGDIEIDLVELFTDLGGLAADRGRGVAVFVDEMQDLGADDVSALCAACHEISQSRLPVIVVGAGLPHLPAVLSAAKSYSERLFGYQRIDRLDRENADLALRVPAEAEEAAYDEDALAALYAATGGYPYFIQAYGKTVWDLAPRSPITAADVAVGGARGRARARGRLLRLALRACDAGGAGVPARHGRRRVRGHASRSPTADVAAVMGKKPQSLSPARDALLKKGLIYSGERGRIAFTVPHFGAFLRSR